MGVAKMPVSRLVLKPRWLSHRLPLPPNAQPSHEDKTQRQCLSVTWLQDKPWPSWGKRGAEG